MSDLSGLHALDVRAIEREHQHVAAYRDSGTAEHDDPIDHLLAGIEPVRGRTIMTDNAAAAFEPFGVDAIRDVSPNPYQEDQNDTEREREAQIVVRVLHPSDQTVKLSGLMSGNSSTLPNVMFNPEIVRIMKHVAVIQCTKRSNALKRTMVRPDLGKNGRWRSNVWCYPGASSVSSDSRKGLELHPTVKPAAMLTDAILDLTHRGDIVLDPFLGSGSTLVASHGIGRRCFGIELDPRYVDVVLKRCRAVCGLSAILESTSETFEVVARRRQSETAPS